MAKSHNVFAAYGQLHFSSIKNNYSTHAYAATAGNIPYMLKKQPHCKLN